MSLDKTKIEICDQEKIFLLVELAEFLEYYAISRRMCSEPVIFHDNCRKYL